MSSKLLGPESAYFAEMVVTAMTNVKSVNLLGENKYPVKNVSILKCHGKSTKESTLVNGYALETGRSAQGMPTIVKDAKIACLDFKLTKYRLQMGVAVLIDDPNKLEMIRQREMDVCKERCKMIIASGANVVLCHGGIDDFALKYFVEAGCIAVRRIKKEDLRKIAKSSGAKVLISLGDEEGDEAFDASSLGHCDKVYEKRVGDNDFIFLEGFKVTKTQTIVLRGANEYMLDEIERSLHDSLCVIKRVLESNEIVAGGGSVEAALSIYLEDFARTLGSREQLAIAEFSEALLVIPKILASNAAKDATDLIGKLRVFHNASQSRDD
jgi:T-complex protein 1 subunit alpha